MDVFSSAMQGLGYALGCLMVMGVIGMLIADVSFRDALKHVLGRIFHAIGEPFRWIGKGLKSLFDIRRKSKAQYEAVIRMYKDEVEKLRAEYTRRNSKINRLEEENKLLADYVRRYKSMNAHVARLQEEYEAHDVHSEEKGGPVATFVKVSGSAIVPLLPQLAHPEDRRLVKGTDADNPDVVTEEFHETMERLEKRVAMAVSSPTLYVEPSEPASATYGDMLYKVAASGHRCDGCDTWASERGMCLDCTDRWEHMCVRCRTRPSSIGKFCYNCA